MAVWSLSRAKNQFSELVHRVAYGNERVILAKWRNQVAAVISIEDLRKLERLEDEADLAAAEEARGEESVSLDDLKRTHNL